MPVGVDAEAGDAGRAAADRLGNQNTVLERNAACGQDVADGQAGQGRVDGGAK